MKSEMAYSFDDDDDSEKEKENRKLHSAHVHVLFESSWIEVIPLLVSFYLKKWIDKNCNSFIIFKFAIEYFYRRTLRYFRTFY